MANVGYMNNHCHQRFGRSLIAPLLATMLQSCVKRRRRRHCRQSCILAADPNARSRLCAVADNEPARGAPEPFVPPFLGFSYIGQRPDRFLHGPECLSRDRQGWVRSERSWNRRSVNNDKSRMGSRRVRALLAAVIDLAEFVDDAL